MQVTHSWCLRAADKLMTEKIIDEDDDDKAVEAGGVAEESTRKEA